MATVSLSMLPKARRMESASSSAWEGCSCWPSPALTTLQSTFCESRDAAPDEPWRTTRMSGFIAFSVTAVSIRVSPLEIDDERGDMLITSAPSRLPASSKLLWVRVEASKKRFTRVRPLSRSTFLARCRLRVTNSSASRSSSSTAGGSRSRTLRKCRLGNGAAWVVIGSIAGARVIKPGL